VAELSPAGPGGGVSTQQSRRWGVLLAGGDAARLRKLTTLICGDDRPKQFCPLFGDETLLGEARRRAKRSISQEQILVLLTGSHQTFYLQEPGILPAQRIVQPANNGTAPPILYSLLSIEQNDNEAIVAILPCDHHYSNEPLFTDALEFAFDIAARHTGSVVLLGEPPRGPEVEYSWIEPGPSVRGVDGVAFRVRRFCEKPSFDVAMDLLRRGCLWNDFSREVLVAQTPRLIVLRMVRTGWSDLGHPERVMTALQAAGLEPPWMKRWKALTHSLILDELQNT
jgi:mannose-1-phosphate guanylyltransferase